MLTKAIDFFIVISFLKNQLEFSATFAGFLPECSGWWLSIHRSHFLGPSWAEDSSLITDRLVE